MLCKAQSADSCKVKLYDIALKDTFALNNYYLSFKANLGTDTACKVISYGLPLWLFFEKHGFSFDQYYQFMMDLLKNDKALDVQNEFNKKKLFYIKVMPNKQNQKALKKGTSYAIKYMIEKGDKTFGILDASIFTDMISSFWDKGIGIRNGEEGNLIVGFNCAGINVRY